MAREINLVPDIKNDMIKALKLRNLIFFLSIVVAAASIGVTVVFGVIAGGQQIAVDSKKANIEELSSKLKSYGDLKEFLTIKDQVSSIDEITNNKKILSRTFNVLSAILPRGADTITISEMGIDLQSESPTFSFEAQANAGQSPFIDYNVLDAFKKSMNYVHYDYGKYVDKEGNNIPAYCIIETNEDGSFFNDPSRGLYGLWTIDAEGCNTNDTSTSSDDNSESTDSSAESTDSQAKADPAAGYETENYLDQRVVRIWRTPQYDDWYKTNPSAQEPQMTLDGEISNVAHFESQCITYSGELAEGNSTPKWTEHNDTCMLVPEGESGITISDSSNGRDESDELVLRFSASITFAPEVFNFGNTHMLALAPSGRRNVTDSYVQIQSMFGERAEDCKAGDTACSNAQTNNNGEER